MKKSSSFVKGFLWLTFAGIICKGIGALYRIPLTNILGTEGIGIYQMVYPIFALVITFANGGIPVVSAREIAALRAKEDFEGAKKLSKASFVLMFVLGLIFSLILLLLSRPISALQGNTSNAFLFPIAALAVFISSVGAGLRNVFVGFEKMLSPAISQIFSQTFKLISGLLLASIFAQRGLVFGAAGALLGVAIGEIFCLAFLWISFIKQKKKMFGSDVNLIFSNKKMENDNKNQEKTVTNSENKQIIETSNGKSKLLSIEKKLYKMSMPVAVANIILPLVTAIESLIVVRILTNDGFVLSSATSLFGIWSGVICSLVNLPSVVALSLSTAIVPAVGFALEKTKEQASKNAKKSIAIVWFFSILCGLGIFVLAPEILEVLYSTSLDFGGAGGGTQLAQNILRFSCLNIVLTSLLQCTISILQAYRKVKKVAIFLAVGGILKVALLIALVSVPSINIWGAVIGSFVFFAVALMLNMVELKSCIGKFVSIKIVVMSLLGVALSILGGFAIKSLLLGQHQMIVMIVSTIAMVAIFFPFVLISAKKLHAKTL